MSLVSYADLNTQVANWLARADLNSYIPDMITLFESAAARRLRVRPGTAVATITTTAGVGSLPSDFLGMIDLSWNGTPQTSLNYVSPTMFIYFNPNNTSDASAPPQNYTFKANQVYLDPIDDTGLTIQYYQKTPALSSSLNWLWTNHPDAYLFGTLAEANYFNKGNALTMAQTWKQRRDEVFDEIQAQEFRERGGLQVQVKGNTP